MTEIVVIENDLKHARKRITKIAEWKRENRDKVRGSYWRNIEKTGRVIVLAKLT